MKRIRQIDKACYLKWQSSKKRGEFVLPFGWIMRQKKLLRKMEKVRFEITPIRCPKIEKAMADAFKNMVREKLAIIEERIKAVRLWQ
jgi:spore coat polysaccharide biosynthesis predicted glycosyltransferase SpsG